MEKQLVMISAPLVLPVAQHVFGLPRRQSPVPRTTKKSVKNQRGTVYNRPTM